MLGILLDACGQPQSLGLLDSGYHMHCDDAMLAERQRPRFVEDHRVEQSRFLEAPAIADEKPIPGAYCCRDRDDQRHGEPERVRTRDDQNRDKSLDCVGRLGAAGQPANESQRPGAERHQCEPESRTVSDDLRP